MTLCEAPPNCCHLANEISRHFFLFLSFLRVLCVPPRILKGVLKRILAVQSFFFLARSCVTSRQPSRLATPPRMAPASVVPNTSS